MANLKILYAAGNNSNAAIQLSRFLRAVEDDPYIIKIAAYKNSFPINHSVDWTLDCLLNIFQPDVFSTSKNDNFEIYFQQIKYFKPDLIISDMEYFTSYIANILNIPIWQCSSSLINFSLKNKYNLGLHKKYTHLINNNRIKNQGYINIIDNSNDNFVYSHLGDTIHPPDLKNNYHWIRPYHSIGKISIPCRHNVVSVLLKENKNIISFLKDKKDSVIFALKKIKEKPMVTIKNIANENEYFCNLRNCNFFICQGQSSFLADAFYNDRYPFIMIDFDDAECLTNAMISEYYKLGSTIYNDFENIEKYINILSARQEKKENIVFLHNKIEKIFS